MLFPERRAVRNDPDPACIGLEESVHGNRGDGKKGEPVYLTKNGYGSMVVLSLEQYAALTDEIEMKLDEADKAAAADSARYTEEEVFGRARSRIHG